MHAKNNHGDTAAQRLVFDNHYPRRHGAGKYHFVILLLPRNALNREAIYSVRRADAGSRLSHALCRRGYLKFFGSVAKNMIYEKSSPY